MSFSIGIIGFPNIGKSTLFKSLTKQKIDIAAYPFTTIHPNIGIVAVPDKRLEDIAKIVKPEKIIPTIIEFVDIAGLVKGAHKGEGLGNQFLAQIRNCDALLEVVRCFEIADIEYAEKNINPQRDIETIRVELLMKDFETLENLLSKIEKDSKKESKKILRVDSHSHLELLKKIKNAVSEGKSISELNLTEKEKSEIQEFQLLTAKPILYILNINSKNKPLELQFKNLIIRTCFQQNLDSSLRSETRTCSQQNSRTRAKLGAGLIPHRNEVSGAGLEITSLGRDARINSCISPSLVIMNLKDEEEFSEFSKSEMNELNFISKIEQLITSCYNILDLISFYTIAGGKETRAWTLKKGETAPRAGSQIHSDFEKKFIRAETIPWQKLVEAKSWNRAKKLGWIRTVSKDHIVEDGEVIEFKI